MNDNNAPFEITTWYDTWNELGLNNLINGIVPLKYATRYNLAFGNLTANTSGGYTVEMPGPYTDAVKGQIAMQAPGAIIFSSLTDPLIPEAVQDNNQYNNRSSKYIASWLVANKYRGISIDAESSGMSAVCDFVQQLSPVFKPAGLGIAVSVPWPDQGPSGLYGNNAVAVFNEYVDKIELQDYSAQGTPADAQIWLNAGINPRLLQGGVSTEIGQYTTSLPDVQAWTQYAMNAGLGGMFSWRLDNDHTNGEEDDQPTFTGAKMIYDTVYNIPVAAVLE
ncbi:hypothetical protein A4D02_27425 [Niastella koreensis]|uniref:GH18 domain-containing protein n=2 Tax=Niastella koreensis TaxID=354356 RepID=G8TGX2_NIAKG|nr:hypothetical protein [Niastella koreensis]AEV99574.1 hypothetical protein Niako_3248 [Niastella koreensis GR20-10]OQP50164.1 hypothetical protein A4D02_27425 [Niastella koreensis]